MGTVNTYHLNELVVHGDDDIFTSIGRTTAVAMKDDEEDKVDIGDEKKKQQEKQKVNQPESPNCDDKNKGHRKRKLYWKNTVEFLNGFMFGSMPRSQEFFSDIVFLNIVDACLRGFGQVVFQNNSICGIFIIIALFLHSVPNGCLSLLGCLCSTLTAMTLKLPKNDIADGLYGYNGALIGSCMGTFIILGWSILLLVPFLSVFSVVLQIGLARFFDLARIPVFTIPFNLVSFLFLLAVQHVRNFDSTLGGGSLYDPKGYGNNTATDVQILFEDEHGIVPVTFSSFLYALILGVGQIFFLTDWISGLIMLIGITFGSPMTTFFALLGSLTGILTGWIFGADAFPVYQGLYGYNAALGSMAMVHFFVANIPCTILSVLCAMFCAIVSATFFALFKVWGLPSLTIPFCFVIVFFYAVGISSPAMRARSPRKYVFPKSLLKDVDNLNSLLPKHIKPLQSDDPPLDKFLGIMQGLHPSVVFFGPYKAKHGLVGNRLEELKNATAYTETEILEKYQQFSVHFPSGSISKADLVDVYKKYFPFANAEKFIELFFKDNEYITFEEFIKSLHVISNGDVNDNLKLMFHVFDHDNTGQIDFRKLTAAIQGVMDILEAGGFTFTKRAVTYATEIFEKADISQLDTITMEEFLNCFKHQSELLDIFRSFTDTTALAAAANEKNTV